jgi:hypothetical protein
MSAKTDPITVNVRHRQFAGLAYDVATVFVRCTKTLWLTEDGRKFARLGTGTNYRGEGKGGTLGQCVPRDQFEKLDAHFGKPR